MTRKASTLSDFCDCTAIGIDVSKARLEVVGLAGETVWQRTFTNTRDDIEALTRTLSEAGYRHKLVCESTGHYHLLLGLVMGYYGLDLRVVNPLQSSKHQKARVRKTKTDAVDARVLATMALTEPELPAAANLQPEGMLIRLKQGQLHSLDKQLQRLSQSLASYTDTYQHWGSTPARRRNGWRRPWPNCGPSGASCNGNWKPCWPPPPGSPSSRRCSRSLVTRHWWPGWWERSSTVRPPVTGPG